MPRVFWVTVRSAPVRVMLDPLLTLIPKTPLPETV
jgi:hypothetical protein